MINENYIPQNFYWSVYKEGTDFSTPVSQTWVEYQKALLRNRTTKVTDCGADIKDGTYTCKFRVLGIDADGELQAMTIKRKMRIVNGMVDLEHLDKQLEKYTLGDRRFVEGLSFENGQIDVHCGS